LTNLKEGQNLKTAQGANTPPNVIANAARFNTQFNDMQIGGNPINVSIGKLLTVMGEQDNTIRILSKVLRLQNGLKRILELKREFYSKDNILKEFKIDDENVVLTSEPKSSLVVSEAIIRSALVRQESRGAHYRSNFPNLE
jgi:succinate dehydrogenase/fumarate reductase flavoprotein subunit